jgi:hypothetical protein
MLQRDYRWFIMKRYWVECEVEVGAPIEQVFEYLTDWPRQGEWMLGTRVENAVSTNQETRTTPLAPGLGDRIRAFTGIGPIGFWDTMTITRWQPPHRVDVVHTGNIVRGIGYMKLISRSKERTTFQWAEEIELPFGLVGRIAWPLVRPIFLAGIRHSLKRFAARAEIAQVRADISLTRP